ncbi:hypothetical protein [Colwellia sp. 12G3]|uniref:hypothetical protein n=1 Tax=Colwellia sp. 12G3 TaxID=2058299 RepID=UPI0012FF3FFF|nr:hypothetical protein [Colwellia sp. 12G3]
MHKSNIIEILQLISSVESQFEYEKNVPIAKVPAELFCTWFDDYYHPNSAEFASSFNADELKDLAIFNQHFDRFGKNIPMNNGVSSLQSNSNWLAIQSYAGKLLEKHSW